MQVALSEFSLVVFTALAPAGAIAYAALALACAVCSSDAFDRRVVQRHFVIPLMVVIIGLIAAATHLGTPANALYVLNGIGRSPLSNEVVAVAIFLAVGGWTWIVSFSDKPIDMFLRVCCTLSAIAALICVHFISVAYAVETIPTWNLAHVPPLLWLGGLSAAVPIALVTLTSARVVPGNAVIRTCLVIMAVAALATAGLTALGSLDIAEIRTTALAGSELTKWQAVQIAVYLALEGIALGAIAWSAKHAYSSSIKAHRVAIGLLVVSCLCALAANLVVRFAFYGTYMTIGL